MLQNHALVQCVVPYNICRGYMSIYIYIYYIHIHIHYIMSKKYMQKNMYIHMKSHSKMGEFLMSTGSSNF